MRLGYYLACRRQHTATNPEITAQLPIDEP
jgi:hypothetical protein